MSVDKRALVSELRAILSGELDASSRRALDAAEAATHEENRAEGDKDMRATEASYIARGQAERVREIEASLAKLASMPIRDLAAGERIEVSAVVCLEHAGVTSHYFLVVAAGGVKLAAGCTTLATTSPLGRALLGLTAGDDAEVVTPQGMKVHAIVSVA